jgi:hypothetical protein
MTNTLPAICMTLMSPLTLIRPFKVTVGQKDLLDLLDLLESTFDFSIQCPIVTICTSCFVSQLWPIKDIHVGQPSKVHVGKCKHKTNSTTLLKIDADKSKTELMGIKAS